MTKPISRKMAVDALLWRFMMFGEVSEKYRAVTDVNVRLTVLPCPICGDAILPEQTIEFDHAHADVHGGPHEYQNLRPLHRDCHKKKTARDIKDNAKVKRLRNGRPPKPKRRWAKGRKLQSKPFQKRKP